MATARKRTRGKKKMSDRNSLEELVAEPFCLRDGSRWPCDIRYLLSGQRLEPRERVDARHQHSWPRLVKLSLPSPKAAYVLSPLQSMSGRFQSTPSLTVPKPSRVLGRNLPVDTVLFWRHSSFQKRPPRCHTEGLSRCHQDSWLPPFLSGASIGSRWLPAVEQERV